MELKSRILMLKWNYVQRRSGKERFEDPYSFSAKLFFGGILSQMQLKDRGFFSTKLVIFQKKFVAKLFKIVKFVWRATKNKEEHERFTTLGSFSPSSCLKASNGSTKHFSKKAFQALSPISCFHSCFHSSLQSYYCLFFFESFTKSNVLSIKKGGAYVVNSIVGSKIQ